MSWGMVDRRVHRCGVGRALLEHRLAELRGFGAVRVSRVQTTAPVVGFFERFGYRVTKAATPGVVPELPLIELSAAL
jgi:ribosomal protein S18 acetylase RimI-like enzyme